MKPALRNALLCVLFLLSPPARALDGTGVIYGTVPDKSTWEVLPGVVVTATSPNLMGEQTVVTDENGFYRLPQLPPGIYQLYFTHEQFDAHSVSTVVVRLNQSYRVNVRLVERGYGDPSPQEERFISLPWRLRRRPAPPPYAPPSPFEMDETRPELGSGKVVPPLPSTASKDTFRLKYFEGYGVNPTVETADEPSSTFPVDGNLDTTSWLIARRALSMGFIPAREEWMRVEEFISAFSTGDESVPDAPFAVHVEGFPSPSRPGYHVLHVSLKAREVPRSQRKASHLVFTVEAFTHMPIARQRGLAKEALRVLLDTLDERDRVSIVAYGRSARLVLPPTSALQRDVLLGAIDGIQPEGPFYSNPHEGLDLAYSLAAANRVEGGINRVILCSAGLGSPSVTEGSGTWERVKDFAAEGITLSTVIVDITHRFDEHLQRLARVGGGNHAYVNDLDDARAVVARNLSGLRPQVARDAKAQLEFDRGSVLRFRLVGYEHRIIHDRYLANDRPDAGQVFSGQTLTAIYEVRLRTPKVADLGTLRLRYKEPEDGRLRELVKELPGTVLRDSYARASPRSRLAYVAAAFAEKLRGSYWVRALSWKQLIDLFEQVGAPQRGRPEVEELGALLRRAAELDRREDRFEAVAPLATMDFDRVPLPVSF